MLRRSVPFLFALAACATMPRVESPPATLAAPAERAAAPADRDYLVYVASEATDKIALVRFGPAGARVERVTPIGIMLADPDGPHGITVAPDGRHWYATTAHGAPFGYLWKFASGSDTPIAKVALGNFPATAQLTPNGALAFVANFNLHGEMAPSSVSVVATDEMVEVARVATCTMPHGSRVNPQGTRHYSACMMDDMLVEIDVGTLAVSRHFMLGRGSEHGMAGPPRQAATGGAAGHDAGASHHGDPTCSPTWAQPSADGKRIFVACNKSDEIVEVDAERWAVTRRLPAGPGVYNLAVSPDGRLLVGTNKRGQSVSVFDVAGGREIARIPTQRRVVHGVVVSPDSRYAFVSVEGVGSEPGTVEVIDLQALRTVATVDVGQMAGGIDFWRSEPSR